MNTMTCKICGKEFSYNKESSCKAKLRVHIENDHHMSLEEYIVKYQYNENHPMCPCGCGRKLSLKTGGRRWEFQKFASDTCYGKMIKAQNDVINSTIKQTNFNVFDISKYYESHYDRDTFETAYKLFSSREMPLTEVAREYNIDKRTLKRIWLILNICTEKELSELTEFYRYNFVVERKGFIEKDSNNVYTWIYLLIKNNPQKYTIESVKKYYNEKNTTKLTCSGGTLYKNLKNLYGNEIDVYLSHGYHSNEEYEFYKVLCFFLPEYKNKIELGKRFESIKSHIIYDFCINNILLIEYDSKGTYHNSNDSNIQDEHKEDFATKNGYKFLRLTKSDVLNPSTIFKIKEMLC